MTPRFLKAFLFILGLLSLCPRLSFATPAATAYSGTASLTNAKRMHVLSDGSILMAGAVTGNFGKLSSDGSTYSTISYNIPLISMSGLDFVMSDDATMYIVTNGASNPLYKYSISGLTASFVASTNSSSTGSSSTSITPDKSTLYVSRGSLAGNLASFNTDLAFTATSSTSVLPIRSMINSAGVYHYVASASGGSVRKSPSFSSGSESVVASSLGTSPVAIYVAPNGTVYIAFAGSIKKVNSAGTVLYNQAITASASTMTLDSGGNIFWATTTGAVRKMTPINSVSSFSATPSGTSIALSWATGVADSDFSGVTICRRTDTYPTSATDGTVVTSDNVGSSFTNSGLSYGTAYYYTIFNKTSDGYYDAGTQATATTLLDPSLSFSPPASLTYGNSTSLSVTSLGSGAVTYSSDNADCGISGSTVTAGAGAGTCTITASQASDSTYAAASTTGSITLAKADQATLTADAVATTIAYNDTATLSTTGGSGSGSVSYAVTAGSSNCSVSGTTLTAIGVGSCTVTATKAADTNYNLATGTVGITVNKANQVTLTADAVSTTIAYNDTTTLSTTGGSGSGSVSYSVTAGSSNCSVSGTTLTAIGVGSCTVTATKAADTNYNATTGTVGITVNKASQAALTATAVSTTLQVAGTTTLSSTGGSGTGTVSFLVATGGSYCSISGATLTADAVGSCTVTATKAADTNYNAVTSNPLAIAVSAPAISLSPTSKDFGAVTLGAFSTAQSVTISNTGSADLILSNISLSDTTNYTLDVSGGISPCTSTTPTITAGHNCTVQVTFAPASAGSKTGNLTIASNDLAHPTMSVALSGTGSSMAVATLEVSPSSKDFGTVTVDESSELQIFTLNNTGTADLIVSDIALSDATNYTLDTQSGEAPCNDLMPTIIADAHCTVGVTFSPLASGALSATLTIDSNDENHASLNIDLTGIGEEGTPSLTVGVTAPTEPVQVGGTANFTVVIENTGGDASNSIVNFTLSDSLHFISAELIATDSDIASIMLEEAMADALGSPLTCVETGIGIVSCDLGTIPAASLLTLNVTTTVRASGAATIAAALQSDGETISSDPGSTSGATAIDNRSVGGTCSLNASAVPNQESFLFLLAPLLGLLFLRKLRPTLALKPLKNKRD